MLLDCRRFISTERIKGIKLKEMLAYVVLFLITAAAVFCLKYCGSDGRSRISVSDSDSYLRS